MEKFSKPPVYLIPNGPLHHALSTLECSLISRKLVRFRLFGVTTLDVVRSSTFAASAIGAPTTSPVYTIPVVGGHSGLTILPILSQASPALPKSLFDDQKALDDLVHRIQFGGDEVVAAKAGAGSATLSMAYGKLRIMVLTNEVTTDEGSYMIAGYKFVDRLIAAAFEGKTGVVEPSYVYIKADTVGGAAVKAQIGDLDYFSLPVELGVGLVSALILFDLSTI